MYMCMNIVSYLCSIKCKFPHLPGISSSVYIYGYLSWSKEIFTGNREGSDERKFLLWTWVGEGVKGYMCSFRQFYYLNLISSWITRECVLGEGGGGVGYPTASSQPVHLNKPKLDFVPSPSHPKLRKHCILVFKKNHRTVLRILAKLPIYRCAYNE